MGIKFHGRLSFFYVIFYINDTILLVLEMRIDGIPSLVSYECYFVVIYVV